ncbi:MAG: mechanosensitive ion channel family protein [Thermoplasmatota archaeon]
MIKLNLDSTIPYLDITLFQALIAVLILIIGWIVAKIVIVMLKRSLKKAGLPPLLRKFMGRILSIVLYLVIVLLAASSLGVNVSSVVLGLSAILGLVLAFGMRDSFNNLAAGMWLATLRPFREKEHVEVDGLEGTVESVGMMSTELLKADNTYITIPNGLVWGSPIINYTRMDLRRVDVGVGIAYESDVNKAVNIAMDFMKNHELVKEDPEPAVTFSELGDSSVNITIKAWTDSDNYWALRNQMTKGIWQEYNKEGIEIPYPHLDVNLEQ